MKNRVTSLSVLFVFMLLYLCGCGNSSRDYQMEKPNTMCLIIAIDAPREIVPNSFLNVRAVNRADEEVVLHYAGGNVNAFVAEVPAGTYNIHMSLDGYTDETAVIEIGNEPINLVLLRPYQSD